MIFFLLQYFLENKLNRIIIMYTYSKQLLLRNWDFLLSTEISVFLYCRKLFRVYRFGGLPRLPGVLSLSFFEIFRFLRTHLGQYQSVFSAGSEVMPTQSQWYQSSHLSQPIIGEPSSFRLHVGHIQT